MENKKEINVNEVNEVFDNTEGIAQILKKFKMNIPVFECSGVFEDTLSEE